MPDLINFSPAAADARARWRKYLTHPELYPRDEDFSELLGAIVAGLRKLCRTPAPVLFLTSAGTGALECAIAALPQEKRILSIRNGYFGQRLFEIARFHHSQVFTFDLPFGQPFDAGHETALIKLLKGKKAEVIICVHLETSATILNDVALVGRIGREHQAITMIDGVSSIGAVDCRLEEWGVSCFVASVYKALMCPTGLSLIVADEEFLTAANRNWSYYLDLRRLADAAAANRFLWSPSVLSLQCLKGTVDEILAAGQDAYFANLETQARQFRSRLEQGGLEILGNPEYLSPCFTAIKLRRNNASEWLARLKKDYGVIIGKGMGEFAENYLRIGHYPHRTPGDLKHLAEALAAVA